MERKIIFWHAHLGSPTRPGDYAIWNDRRYGIVLVAQADVERAATLGQNPQVVVYATSIPQGGVTFYSIADMCREDETVKPHPFGSASIERRYSDRRQGERRKGQRRQGERRKANQGLPVYLLETGLSDRRQEERRQAERRQGERRRSDRRRARGR